jgi:hypothetical protein
MLLPPPPPLDALAGREELQLMLPPPIQYSTPFTDYIILVANALSNVPVHIDKAIPITPTHLRSRRIVIGLSAKA